MPRLPPAREGPLLLVPGHLCPEFPLGDLFAGLALLLLSTLLGHCLDCPGQQHLLCDLAVVLEFLCPPPRQQQALLGGGQRVLAGRVLVLGGPVRLVAQDPLLALECPALLDGLILH
jgi:hypothetical protein